MKTLVRLRPIFPGRSLVRDLVRPAEDLLQLLLIRTLAGMGGDLGLKH